jgi:protocatechuate 3,4-dioxygenase beta subunit
MAGRAWWDQNGDGIQADGEVGWPAATVKLLDSGNNVIATTQTDNYGDYQFDDLNPGNYSVEFLPPIGTGISPQNQGTNDWLDSDPNPTTGITAPIQLSSGELNWTTDAGLTSTGGPPPLPSQVGDRVWADEDGNGLQDPGEPGIANVAVRLLNSSGTVVASTTTDADGAYQFSNVAPGTYRVQFSNLPAGFQFTLPFQGADDAVDSNVTDFAAGKTDPFTITTGNSDLGIDAGLLPSGTATVGDFVWQDRNGDGIQDAGEPGKSGVGVELHSAASGALVATTTTAADGSYSFSNVQAGQYYLKFIRQSGYKFSPQHAGWPTEDSDPAPVSGRTPVFAVAGGHDDDTLDAGLITAQTGSLGGWVWYDGNQNGIREPGELLAGAEVTVQLLDPTGVVLDTTTPVNGQYSFTALPVGSFRVRFLIPAGLDFTIPNQGSDETRDSDVTGQGTTDLIAFTGITDLTWNAGIILPNPNPPNDGG